MLDKVNKAVLVFLVLLFGSAIAAPDYQSLEDQDGSNRQFFYLYDGTPVDTTAEFRAYIINADTSSADNQIDGVRDSDSGGWDFPTRRDTWVAIYRIDGTDVEYDPHAFFHGGRLGVDAADDSTIVDGSITTADLGDSIVTQVKVAQWAIGTDQIELGAVGSLQMTDASVLPSKMATGEKFFTIAGSDSIESAYAEILELMAYTGGAGVIRGSWTFDDTSPIIFDGPQVTFEDSVKIDASLQADNVYGQHAAFIGDLSANGVTRLGNSASDSTLVYGNGRVTEELTVGSSGDTTTTHTVTGFWHMTSAQILTIPAASTSGVLAYPGAVEGMYFTETSADGVGTSLLLRKCSFVYESPGHVSYRCTQDIANSRDFFVIGWKGE